MKKYNLINRRDKSLTGFTLIEMLVVLAIIAGLAALVIPMLGGVSEKGAKAADAANQADLSRQILSFAELHRGNYPNVWDSLLEAKGNPLGFEEPTSIYGGFGMPSWGNKGLYLTLRGMGTITGASPMIFANNLSSGGGGMIAGHGIAKLGIDKVIDHEPYNETTGTGAEYPNDSTDNVEIREFNLMVSTTVALLKVQDLFNNETGKPGQDGKIDNHFVEAIYDHFKLEVPKSPETGKIVYLPDDALDDKGTAVDLLDDELSGDFVIAFGIGKENTMVGNLNCGLQTAPSTTAFNLDEYYGRYIALFKAPRDWNGKAQFLGVLDPRGMLIDYNQKEFASTE